jgi:hypothetical protein
VTGATPGTDGVPDMTWPVVRRETGTDVIAVVEGDDVFPGASVAETVPAVGAGDAGDVVCVAEGDADVHPAMHTARMMNDRVLARMRVLHIFFLVPVMLMEFLVTPQRALSQDCLL